MVGSGDIRPARAMVQAITRSSGWVLVSAGTTLASVLANLVGLLVVMGSLDRAPPALAGMLRVLLLFVALVYVGAGVSGALLLRYGLAARALGEAPDAASVTDALEHHARYWMVSGGLLIAMWIGSVLAFLVGLLAAIGAR